MYLPFVMYGYAAALILVLFGCWVILRAVPNLRGIRELAAAVAAAIVAVLLVGFRPWAPAILTILLGNCVLIAAFVLIYWSTAQVLGEGKRFLPWACGLCIAILPPFCYSIWIHPSILWRIWISSGTLAFLSLATAVLLFRHRSPALIQSTGFLGFFSLLTAAINAGRCILSGLFPPADFIHGDWIQVGFTYGQLVLCLGTCCGIVWISICRNRAELEKMALTDSLTNLLNRRAFDEILQRAVHRANHAGAGLGLILLDLDHFKEVNDQHGHNAGDETLRRVSAVLKQATRPADTLARYGGEEFALLVRSDRVEEIQTIAERLREAIAAAPQIPGVHLTVSAGIALHRPGDTAETLVDQGDNALYSSKRAGRNVVTLSDSASAPALEKDPLDPP